MKTILAILLALTVTLHADDDAEKILKNRVVALTRKVSMDGHQVSSMGITGTMRMEKPVRKEVPGNKFKIAYEWVSDGIVDGVLCGAKGASAGESVDATGRHLGLPDTTTTVISWSGKAWPIGKIQYKTQQGLLRTCELWTASEEEALNFYRKHGFTQAAKDHVKSAK